MSSGEELWKEGIHDQFSTLKEMVLKLDDLLKLAKKNNDMESVILIKDLQHNVVFLSQQIKETGVLAWREL